MPKALGTMNFIKLFKKLLQQNISGAIIRVLLEFYFSQNVSIFGVLFFILLDLQMVLGKEVQLRYNFLWVYTDVVFKMQRGS